MMITQMTGQTMLIMRSPVITMLASQVLLQVSEVCFSEKKKKIPTLWLSMEHTASKLLVQLNLGSWLTGSPLAVMNFFVA